MKVTEEEITPEMAYEMLGHNIANRNLVQGHVLTLARDMKNEKWDDNGETIKIAASGKLLDGQHRLTAIATSGVTIKMLVVRGLKDDDQKNVDVGRKRLFADHLKITGEKNTHQLAALTRAVASWNAGDRGYIRQFTTSELIRTLDENPDLREALGPASTVRSLVPNSIGGVCYWLFNKIDSEDADHFYDRLRSDLGHSEGDPITALRKALRTNQHVGGGNPSQRRFTFALMIKAWNAYRNDKKITTLTFKAGGANPEKFPEPV